MDRKEYCFVCQRFDNGKYDKRYDDIIEPVIYDCGLEPYRVDRDPSVDNVFDDIKEHVKSAVIVIAEMSTDNPNVWLEIGLAIAYNKPIVFLCERNTREKFPFDISHRKILVYDAGSDKEIKELKRELKNQILAKLDRWGRSKNPRPTVLETAFLKALAGHSDLSDKERAAINQITEAERTVLIKSLLNKNLIQYIQQGDTNVFNVELTDKACNLKAIKEGALK